MSGKKLVVAAVLLALAQIAFLSWIIAGRAAILRDGQEVLLKIEPVDPRDLLRGDYVVADLRDTEYPGEARRECAGRRIRDRRRADLRAPRQGLGWLLARPFGIARRTVRQGCGAW